MLYSLSEYFEQLDIWGARLWGYVSFRSLMALLLSLFISLWFGKRFIKYMKRNAHIESARDAEIDPYGVQKKGVPSMGGVVIIAAVAIPALLLGRLDNVYVLLLIVSLLWFGLLGFIDDKIKLSGNKDGMKPIYKLLGQLFLGCVIGVSLWLSPQAVVRENVTQTIDNSEVVYHKSEERKSTVTTVPFVKTTTLTTTRCSHGLRTVRLSVHVVGFCSFLSQLLSLQQCLTVPT